MKIMYLNVWGDEMREELIPYLEEHARDTDAFCFQEATEAIKRRCADILTDFNGYYADKFISENDTFSQAIYVRKSSNVISSGILMENETDCGLANYIQIEIERKQYYICNVHGKARPSDKLDDPGRMKQSQEITDFFKDTLDPVVIGGDFNILPNTQSIKMFKEHSYRDLIQEFGIETTRNRLVWDRYPVKMYYSDYIFLNDKVSLTHFSVIENEVSDHLPLLLDIS